MHCLHPINIRNPNFRPCDGKDLFIQVPCGRCIACQERRRTEWALRLETEAKYHSPWFVTLTYSPECLPTVNPDTGAVCPSGCLNPGDVTKFLKRYRKALDNEQVSYFYCGEYGASGNRPHYHMILFQDGNLDDISLRVEKAWGNGFTLTEYANLMRFRYVAKYVVKLGNDRIDPNSIPPFAHMSTKIDTGKTEFRFDSEGNVITHKSGPLKGEPKEYKITRGLGVPSEKVIQWHRDNDDYSSRLSSGEVLSMPRYIKDKTFSRIEQDLHKIAVKNSEQRRFEFLENNGGFIKAFKTRLADDVAWENFKIKQFAEHYLKKKNGRL